VRRSRKRRALSFERSVGEPSVRTGHARCIGVAFMEPTKSPPGRRDLVIASLFTFIGLVAVVLRGNLGNMVAGSVGTVGAAVAAVGLALADPRLSYAQKAQAGLGIATTQLACALALGENALAFVGYPLLLLGVAGLASNLASFKPRPEPSAASQRSRSAGAHLPSTSRA
jgi:hypothetical protein